MSVTYIIYCYYYYYIIYCKIYFDALYCSIMKTNITTKNTILKINVYFI